MIWHDFLLGKHVSDADLRAALAAAFGIEEHAVDVVHSAEDIQPHRPIVAELSDSEGEFPLKIALYASDVAQSASPAEVLQRLCDRLETSALTPDESADPYNMILFGVRTKPRPVAVDVDALDQRGEYRVVRETSIPMNPPPHDVLELVDLSSDDPPAFEHALAQMSEPKLVSLYAEHLNYEQELKEAGLRAYMGEPVTEDALDDLAKWIVDQGIDAFVAAIRDVQGAARLVRDDGWKTPKRPPSHSSWRDVRKLLGEAYQTRYGAPIRKPEEPADWIWRLVDLARTDMPEYRKRLSEMDRTTLIDLYWDLEEAAADLRGQPYVDHMGPDTSEDDADEIAVWVLSRGRDEYMKVLNNPELVPKEISEHPVVRAEVVRALMDRFGERFVPRRA
jgi:hypothetical protein